MKKKNLLLIVNQLHGGGAQKVIANLSIQLFPFYNITLVIYNDTDKVVFDFKGEMVKLKLPYAEDTHNNPFRKRLVRSLALVKQVRKLKKDLRIDVTISFLESSNIINVLSRRRDKIILSVRSYLSHEFADLPRLKVFKTFIRLLYNRADDIVVPADLVKHDLVTNFGIAPGKLSLIYNFTDLNVVEELKKASIPQKHRDIFSDGPVIVNIGRINQPKAQWLQPLVLARVKKSIPGARLLILGDGPLKERIEENARKEGLTVYETPLNESWESIKGYDVYLTGFAKNPFPYLSKSTLFLKSSVYEGFPNVIIEAMSCGLPIVSSDCASGPREILEPSSDILSKTKTIEFAEYGVLTAVAEPGTISDDEYADDAAKAIIAILSDPARMDHYRKQSLKRAQDFDVQNIINQWVELIEKN